MGLFKQVIAGCIGGLLGALIWAGISYATNYEVGWIAWGIGFLVGFCVRLGAGEAEGNGSGVVAAGIALGSVLLGKYLAVHMAVASAAANFDVPEVTPTDMQLQIANEVLDEREKAGKPAVIPNGKTRDDVESLADLPPDVRSEAEKQWTALSAEQQSARIAETKQQYAMIRDALVGHARSDAFTGSFSPFDLLWFGLAAFTAFKLGSGANED